MAAFVIGDDMRLFGGWHKGEDRKVCPVCGSDDVRHLNRYESDFIEDRRFGPIYLRVLVGSTCLWLGYGFLFTLFRGGGERIRKILLRDVGWFYSNEYLRLEYLGYLIYLGLSILALAILALVFFARRFPISVEDNYLCNACKSDWSVSGKGKVTRFKDRRKAKRK